MADAPTAVARRRSGFEHEVEIDGRHRITSDEPVEAGGGDAGASPTRLLAAALAACTAITVEMYAERKGWELGPLEVEVQMAYENHAPRRFDIGLNLPEDLDASQIERLLVIAGKCPVHRSLAAEIEVEIVPGALGS